MSRISRPYCFLETKKKKNINNYKYESIYFITIVSLCNHRLVQNSLKANNRFYNDNKNGQMVMLQKHTESACNNVLTGFMPHSSELDQIKKITMHTDKKRT